MAKRVSSVRCKTSNESSSPAVGRKAGGTNMPPAPFSDKDARPVRIGEIVHWSRKGICCLPIVNCGTPMILPELLDEHSDMVAGLMERFYAAVGRYSASPFCM